MLSHVSEIIEKAYDFLYPKRCVGCGREGEFICSSCQKQLSPVGQSVCYRCGTSLSSGSVCSGCADWEAKIDGIRSAFRFDGVAREAVHQLKYRNLRAIAPIMARIMLPCFLEYHIPGEVIIPIPLHSKRLKERGYNQGLLLAKELGKIIGLQVDENSLKKLRHTSPQARTASLEERRSNINDAFSCGTGNLRGIRVILIDDVTTSGATMDACAAALKKAGAASVWGFTFAREI